MSCYVIVQLIYNPCIFSLLSKWGISPVFTFGFWKLCICTCQTRKSIICDSQRSRSVLLLGLCWASNAGRLHKWNTWSKPPPHRPCTCCHAYFLFLLTCDAYLAVWDSHTDVNWHLGDTWLLYIFCKFGQLNLLCWRSPSFDPCSFLALLSCGLVLLCSKYHFAPPAYLEQVGMPVKSSSNSLGWTPRLPCIDKVTCLAQFSFLTRFENIPWRYSLIWILQAFPRYLVATLNMPFNIFLKTSLFQQ